MINILEQLALSGSRVSLLALRSKKAYKNTNKEIKIMAVPLRFMPFLSTFMFMVIQFFFLPIYVLFSKVSYVIYDPDLHILSCFPLFLVTKLTRKKLVLDIRSVPVETVGLRGYMRTFWFSCSILVARKLFDGLTIITPSMKEKICNDYGLKPAQVGVWTSGVSQDLFDPSKYEKSNLKKYFKLEDKFVVFYHGVFTPTRALKETIQAIALLAPKYPDVILFLLGSGPSLNGLKIFVEKENLERHVLFVDPVDHSKVPEFINICDVGIIPLPDHPYWRFQSPLKLLEYLAMGKVVVLTDIPAHRAVIGDSDCGIYTSTVDPFELARGIEKAYMKKNRACEYGRICRLIIRDYTWEKVASDLKNYLLSL
jgi:glycosyltransferase involved in cell wall biosynthesis